jgi:hypothetical protein
MSLVGSVIFASSDATRLMGKKVIAALVGIDKSQVPLDMSDEQFIDLTSDPQAYRRLKEGLNDSVYRGRASRAMSAARRASNLRRSRAMTT